MNEERALKPVTIDDIRNAGPFRGELLRQRKAWLKDVRKQDRREAKNATIRKLVARKMIFPNNKIFLRRRIRIDEVLVLDIVWYVLKTEEGVGVYDHIIHEPLKPKPLPRTTPSTS